MAPLFYINANINGALWLKDDANLNMLHFQKFIYGVERQNISVLFFFSFLQALHFTFICSKAACLSCLHVLFTWKFTAKSCLHEMNWLNLLNLLTLLTWLCTWHRHVKYRGKHYAQKADLTNTLYGWKCSDLLCAQYNHLLVLLSRTTYFFFFFLPFFSFTLHDLFNSKLYAINQVFTNNYCKIYEYDIMTQK